MLEFSNIQLVLWQWLWVSKQIHYHLYHLSLSPLTGKDAVRVLAVANANCAPSG